MPVQDTAAYGFLLIWVTASGAAVVQSFFTRAPNVEPSALDRLSHGLSSTCDRRGENSFGERRKPSQRRNKK